MTPVEMIAPGSSSNFSALAASPAFALHQATRITDISMDVLVHILSLLQPVDILSASMVSKLHSRNIHQILITVCPTRFVDFYRLVDHSAGYG